MQQLPRFLSAARHLMQPDQLAAVTQLVEDSSDAAWASRTLPPFPTLDVCNQFREPEGGPPKFSWDWGPLPEGEFICMDARTQSQVLSLFIADLQIAQMLRNAVSGEA